MKILAVGCSFTYGAELPDVPVDTLYHNIPPSQYAYPALLGKMYNAEVVNLGKPGGSNSRIFRLALDESLKNKYDLIICGWSDLARVDLQHNGVDLPTTVYSKWAFEKFPWVESYYKHHYNDNHALQTWLTQLIALQNHFKHNNQKYLFLSMQRPIFIDKQVIEKYNHLIRLIDTEHYLGWPMFGMTDWMGDCPKGISGHPLELGHQRIAEKIDEHIRNLGWFPRCSSNSN